MIEKVLVPVDASAFAERAIPMARTIARNGPAALRLAMVNEPVDLPPGPWAEAFLENHARYLAQLTAVVQEATGAEVSVTSTLLEGPVAQALRDEAVSWGADLVVMSTHGHGGVTRAWMGSVADDLVRQSPVPVMLVRPEEVLDDETTAPASFDRVVVPLDGSDFAEAALVSALEIRDAFDVPLTLFRAVEYPRLVSSYLPDAAVESAAFVRQAEERAIDDLEAVRARIQGGRGAIETEVVVSSAPARAILEYVEGSGSPLLVMASHARHGLSRVLLGSVTDKVVRGATTPVLVVHPIEGSITGTSEEVA